MNQFDIQINGTRFNSDDTVRIDFRGIDQEGQINLNGYVPVTTMEFFEHSGSMETLENLVREKVAVRICGEQENAE